MNPADISNILGEDIGGGDEEEDEEGTIRAFAAQLTEIRKKATENRDLITKVHASTNSYCTKMHQLSKGNSSVMELYQGMALQASLNNQFLHHQQFALRLSHAQHWHKFTTDEPVGLFHLYENTYAVTGQDHSVDVIDVDTSTGFKCR